MSQIRHPVTYTKINGVWTPVREVKIISRAPRKTLIKFYPNWLMLALLAAAIPAAAFLITPPEEEMVEREVLPIVDTMQLYPVEHDFTDKSASNKIESRFAEWMWYLKVREGFIPSIYRCPAGIRTIGYGHNVEAHGHDGPKTLTYQQASLLLYRDIEKQYAQVEKLLPHLNRNQKLAITSLAANCGIAKIMYVRGNPKKGFSEFWKKARLGKVPNFEDYTKYKTPKGKVVKSPNLVSARNFEKLLYQGSGKLPILVGFRKGSPIYREMTFEEAAEIYKKQLIKRDILPAKQGGYY